MHPPLYAGRLLGTLEHHVMQTLWSMGSGATVREVTDRMRIGRPVAYTTLLTVMTRLTAKGLLIRSKEAPHVYSARFAPQKFYQSIAGMMFARIRKDFGELAIACFAEEANKAHRKKLRRLLRDLRAQEK